MMAHFGMHHKMLLNLSLSHAPQDMHVKGVFALGDRKLQLSEEVKNISCCRFLVPRVRPRGDHCVACYYCLRAFYLPVKDGQLAGNHSSIFLHAFQ